MRNCKFFVSTAVLCLSACSAVGVPTSIYKHYQFDGTQPSKQFSLVNLSEIEAKSYVKKLGIPWDPTMNRFFVVQAPEQRSAGSIFRFELLGNTLRICLELPTPFAPVTLEINTPSALVLTQSTTLVVTPIGICEAHHVR